MTTTHTRADEELARFADHRLDLRGLDCPRPLLETRACLARMAPGEVVHVRCTDPHSAIDFGAFCARTGHGLLHDLEAHGVWHFWIAKRA